MRESEHDVLEIDSCPGACFDQMSSLSELVRLAPMIIRILDEQEKGGDLFELGHKIRREKIEVIQCG